jgi:DNA modification methylase
METVTIGNATLILGDSLEWIDALPECFRVDATLTDPPYGVNFEYADYIDTPEAWESTMHRAMPHLLRISKALVLPCGRRSNLKWWLDHYPPKWHICWYKGACPTRSPIGFSDWEMLLFWGQARHVHDHFTTPSHDKHLGPSDHSDSHPCPKPLAYSTWQVSKFSEIDQRVFDPFMGSGTTGVAAVLQERKFIGIEMSRPYFDVACGRIEAAQNQLRLFA